MTEGKPVGNTGLKLLQRQGVPDGFLTALLALLSGLTLIPYIAGREFGPYTIPQLLPPSTFWTLTVAAPVAWLALLAPIFDPERFRWRSAALILVVLELSALIIAFPMSPKTETRVFTSRLSPGQESASFPVVLPSAQMLEATLAEVSPANGLSINICGASESENCRREQRGIGESFVRYLPKGGVTLRVFNFRENPPVDFVLTVKYVARRWF